MRKLWFVVIFLVGLIFVIFWGISFLAKQKIATISNFDECAAAGYPVMESYPAQCMTPDKRSFTQSITTSPLPDRKLSPSSEPRAICEDTCGDNHCAEVVCFGAGCSCPETPETCPQDCPYDR